ncbi:hypothetical protein, partial [Thiolapillus sp.]
MTRTSGAPIGCQRPSRFWGLGCPKIFHEAEDTLGVYLVALHDIQPAYIEGLVPLERCVHRIGVDADGLLPDAL